MEINKPSATKGLRNLGNTCFFNSVVQVLSQTPSFITQLHPEYQKTLSSIGGNDEKGVEADTADGANDNNDGDIQNHVVRKKSTLALALWNTAKDLHGEHLQLNQEENIVKDKVKDDESKQQLQQGIESGVKENIELENGGSKNDNKLQNETESKKEIEKVESKKEKQEESDTKVSAVKTKKGKKKELISPEKAPLPSTKAANRKGKVIKVEKDEKAKKKKRGDGAVSPDPLFFEIVQRFPMFKGFRQHDAQELLICMLSAMQDEEEGTAFVPQVKQVPIPGPEKVEKNFYGEITKSLAETEDMVQLPKSASWYFSDKFIVENKGDIKIEPRIEDDEIPTALPLCIFYGYVEIGKNSPPPLSPGESEMDQQQENDDSENGSKDEKEAENEVIKKEEMKKSSSVRDIFTCQLRNITVCDCCSRKTETFEEQPLLSLEIPEKERIAAQEQVEPLSGMIIPKPTVSASSEMPLSKKERRKLASASSGNGETAKSDNYDSNFAEELLPEPSIDLLKEGSVLSCLGMFTKTEALKVSDDNGFACPSCKSLQNARRRTIISKLPKVLILHLKRFKMVRNKKSGAIRLSKSDAEIKILEEIEIPDGSMDSIKRYRLYGVIVHEGSLNAGHYYCYVRQRISNAPFVLGERANGSVSNDVKMDGNTWYCFSDHHVTKSSIEGVKKAQPYILFYEEVE